MYAFGCAEYVSFRVSIDLRTIIYTIDTYTDKIHRCSSSMATIFYARVSTAEQSLDHQKAQAEAAGFQIDEVVADHGVSGVTTTLKERPEGKRLFDLLRSGDVLVVRWVDRLGRNYKDVTDTVREFIRRGIIIRTVINNLTFDGATSDPMQEALRDSMIAFMAAMAQAEAEVKRSAQRSGIDAAKGKGDRYLGRKPSFTRKQFEDVQNMLALGKGAAEIAKLSGVSRQTVYRIKQKPAKCEKALAVWGG